MGRNKLWIDREPDGWIDPSDAHPPLERESIPAELWREMIILAVESEPELLDSLAHHLEEVGKTRQILRDKGYGVIGTSILEQVGAVPGPNPGEPGFGHPSLEQMRRRDQRAGEIFRAEIFEGKKP